MARKSLTTKAGNHPRSSRHCEFSAETKKGTHFEGVNDERILRGRCTSGLTQLALAHGHGLGLGKPSLSSVTIEAHKALRVSVPDRHGVVHESAVGVLLLHLLVIIWDLHLVNDLPSTTTRER